MATDLQSNNFSVYSLNAVDGGSVRLASNLPAEEAAGIFWHYTNNVSAKAGIIREVRLVDGLDCTCLSWEFGRGYSYDGEIWTDTPVMPMEPKDYAKKKTQV